MVPATSPPGSTRTFSTALARSGSTFSLSEPDSIVAAQVVRTRALVVGAARNNFV